MLDVSSRQQQKYSKNVFFTKEVKWAICLLYNTKFLLFIFFYHKLPKKKYTIVKKNNFKPNQKRKNYQQAEERSLLLPHQHIEKLYVTNCGKIVVNMFSVAVVVNVSYSISMQLFFVSMSVPYACVCVCVFLIVSGL